MFFDELARAIGTGDSKELEKEIGELLRKAGKYSGPQIPDSGLSCA